MKQFTFTIALALFSLLAALPARAEEQYAIAAVVNDDAISKIDVEDRMKMVMVSSGIPDNPEIRAKIRSQVIEGLIEDHLKLQEAKRDNYTVDDQEIDDAFKTIAEQNKLTPDQFETAMERGGVPKRTLTMQIKATLAWNKVVKDKLRREVEVNNSDVDTRIERLKSRIGQTEYLVAEIFLPLNDPKRNADVIGLASRMAAALQAHKAPFGPVAVQFSKAPGADKGGLIGWVQQGQLPAQLDKVLMGMAEGQVSDPVKMKDGLYLLNLQKKRTLTADAIPPRDDIMNEIGTERLIRVQQRALEDLKASAFIDRRA